MVYFISAAFLLVTVATAETADPAKVSCDPCIDRSSVKMGVVTHGVPSQDVYWQQMDTVIAQGAHDMGIELLYDPIDDASLSDQGNIFETMIGQIEEFCGGDDDGAGVVNALLVTLPSSSILESLDTCKKNNVKVAAFNAGVDIAQENGFLFFGQGEFEAGLYAGSGLANVNTTEKFCCADHAPGNQVLIDRCGGMAAGVEASGKGSTSSVVVDPNNCTLWSAAITAECSPEEGKDWSTIGLYLGGQPHHRCAVEFLEQYPEAYVGASDVSDDLYAGMNAGLNILFGIDQQSYLQGYLPSSFLTLAVTNNQMVQNEMIKTGPALVTEPPSEDFQTCAANNYAVCDAPGSSSAAYTIGIMFSTVLLATNAAILIALVVY